ncbi:hypothetical protein [Simkania sp.]|uniref:hypothetical protein n=1 Tax=Simkania sp. TaxID=34094 RepID=UPI003B529D46
MSVTLYQQSEQKVNSTPPTRASESKTGIDWRGTANTVIEYSIDAFCVIGKAAFGNPWMFSVEDLTGQLEEGTNSSDSIREVSLEKPNSEPMAVNSTYESVQEKINQLLDVERTCLKHLLEITKEKHGDADFILRNVRDARDLFPEGISDDQIKSDLNMMLKCYPDLKFNSEVESAPAANSVKERVQAKINQLPGNVKKDVASVLLSSKNKGRDGQALNAHHPTLREMFFDSGASQDEVHHGLQLVLDDLSGLFGSSLSVEDPNTQRIQGFIDQQPEGLKYILVNTVMDARKNGLDSKTVNAMKELFYDELTSDDQVYSYFKFMMDNVATLNFGHMYGGNRVVRPEENTQVKVKGKVEAAQVQPALRNMGPKKRSKKKVRFASVENGGGSLEKIHPVPRRKKGMKIKSTPEQERQRTEEYWRGLKNEDGTPTYSEKEVQAHMKRYDEEERCNALRN